MEEGMYLKVNDDCWVLISPEDEKKLTSYSWRPKVGRNNLYFFSRIGKGIMMHRVVMNAKKGQIIDHINGNTLDNRRENLRVVTPQQSSINRILNGGSSLYKGVFRRKNEINWSIKISNKNKLRNFSGIKNEKVAALVYDLVSYDTFGEYTKFNLPEVSRQALKQIEVIQP